MSTNTNESFENRKIQLIIEGFLNDAHALGGTDPLDDDTYQRESEAVLLAFGRMFRTGDVRSWRLRTVEMVLNQLIEDQSFALLEWFESQDLSGYSSDGTWKTMHPSDTEEFIADYNLERRISEDYTPKHTHRVPWNYRPGDSHLADIIGVDIESPEL